MASFARLILAAFASCFLEVIQEVRENLRGSRGPEGEHLYGPHIDILFTTRLDELKRAFAESDHWAYGGKLGPSNWPEMFFTCSGSRQSPINIETGSVKKEFWKPFTFKNYDASPTRMRVKNNGHSAQVEMDAPNAPRVREGGLKGEYIFAHFHFHWGRDNAMGSEHTIDGVRYPMELHLVHYKGAYGTLQEAIKHPDGLAVFGVLFEVTKSDNAAFAPLASALENVKMSGKVADVPANNPLRAFLPSDTSSFFRYTGSLTTPTCNEVVIWTVFRTTIPISNGQLIAFRSLLNDEGLPLEDNFRPPQQLKRRNVYMSSSESGSESTLFKTLSFTLYFMSTMAVLM